MSQDKRTKFNTQISEEAAEWFIEFRLGDLDATGRREFDSWIRSSPEHLRAYLETAAIWNEGDSLTAHRDLDSDALIALARSEGNVVPLELDALRILRAIELTILPSEGGTKLTGQPPATSRLSGRRFLSLAAALTLALVGGAVTVLWHLAPDAVYTSAVGERRILRLADGSTVELNSRSRVRVRFSQEQRDVELLEGQALFEVAKDAHRPFVVRSDSLRVRAIGTQFDVNRKTTDTTVTVVEGRVSVYRDGTPEPSTAIGAPARQSRTNADLSTLSPREGRGGLATPKDEDKRAAALDAQQDGQDQNPVSAMALRSAGSAAIVLSAGEQLTVDDHAALPQPLHTSPAVATAWTHGQLVLDSATLTNVAEQFNRYSTRRLVVEDHGARPLKLSGVFATDPGFLLRYLRQRADITIQESQTEVHIIRHD